MRRYGDDIDKMQQEAVRRMQEMQNRGRTPQNTEPIKKEQNLVSKEVKEENKIEQPDISFDSSKIQINKKQNSFFEALLHDKERSLILLLLILLSTEKTDIGVILALVYLLI